MSNERASAGHERGLQDQARNGRSKAVFTVLPFSLLLAACATSEPSRDVVVDRPVILGAEQNRITGRTKDQGQDQVGDQASSRGMTQTTMRVSADAVFDAYDSDADGGLTPLDIERLQLGGNWHTLDFNGDGSISRSEFRRLFATPLIQTSMRLPSDPGNMQPTVSPDYALPPLPDAQRYVPAPIDATAPVSITLPTNAPLVIPVLIDDQEAANINRSAESTDDHDQNAIDTDAEMPAY